MDRDNKKNNNKSSLYNKEVEFSNWRDFHIVSPGNLQKSIHGEEATKKTINEQTESTNFTSSWVSL